ncbi:hypothetical protein [Burkholderia ambifaria]|uniref:Uncharacterized protein n=1 Tax=Burkholderia ambifaria MEX-5 TaxID=396597 RepID=B1T4G5_9BURK|nr:hypothetical protein [Burkholderia ambifaria]EDT41563.1 hypothetical protein BamMEX5DRAFT_2681 [Burkholderia ambifaria MEX-5]
MYLPKVFEVKKYPPDYSPDNFAFDSVSIRGDYPTNIRCAFYTVDATGSPVSIKIGEDCDKKIFRSPSKEVTVLTFGELFEFQSGWINTGVIAFTLDREQGGIGPQKVYVVLNNNRGAKSVRGALYRHVSPSLLENKTDAANFELVNHEDVFHDREHFYSVAFTGGDSSHGSGSSSGANPLNIFLSAHQWTKHLAFPEAMFNAGSGYPVEVGGNGSIKVAILDATGALVPNVMSLTMRVSTADKGIDSQSGLLWEHEQEFSGKGAAAEFPGIFTATNLEYYVRAKLDPDTESEETFTSKFVPY